jgi:hypothetical protein
VRSLSRCNAWTTTTQPHTHSQEAQTLHASASVEAQPAGSIGTHTACMHACNSVRPAPGTLCCPSAGASARSVDVASGSHVINNAIGTTSVASRGSFQKAHVGISSRIHPPPSPPPPPDIHHTPAAVRPARAQVIYPTPSPAHLPGGALGVLGGALTAPLPAQRSPLFCASPPGRRNIDICI